MSSDKPHFRGCDIHHSVIPKIHMLKKFQHWIWFINGIPMALAHSEEMLGRSSTNAGALRMYGFRKTEQT